MVRGILSDSPEATEKKWMQAVAARAFNARPDLSIAIGDIISVEPSEQNPLENLSIGEIGVCYEAVKALQDSGVRRQDGQYFTPDDAARFMAEQSLTFPPGRWVDPCCGVGNLAWHLTEMQSNPEEFVKNQLVLNDKDKVALKTAVVLLGAQFLALSDQDGMREMMGRRRGNSIMQQPSRHKTPNQAG